MFSVENVGIAEGGVAIDGLSFCGTFFFLRDVLFNPGADEFGDIVAILFQHHLVAVAVDAHVFEPDKLRVHAGLIQPLGEARIGLAVISPLRGEINHGNLFEIDELVRGLFLHVAGNHVPGRIGFFFQNRLQLRGILQDSSPAGHK